ncbi:MAG: hypothetical protein RIS47_1564 [Bacteroidota bacterium]|jgi:hypothetical protein
MFYSTFGFRITFFSIFFVAPTPNIPPIPDTNNSHNTHHYEFSTKAVI